MSQKLKVKLKSAKVRKFQLDYYRRFGWNSPAQLGLVNDKPKQGIISWKTFIDLMGKVINESRNFQKSQ